MCAVTTTTRPRSPCGGRVHGHQSGAWRQAGWDLRVDGWYATRPRGMLRHAEPVDPSTARTPGARARPPRPGAGGPSCSARSSRSTRWRARDAVGPCGSSRSSRRRPSSIRSLRTSPRARPRPHAPARVAPQQRRSRIAPPPTGRRVPLGTGPLPPAEPLACSGRSVGASRRARTFPDRPPDRPEGGRPVAGGVPHAPDTSPRSAEPPLPTAPPPLDPPSRRSILRRPRLKLLSRTCSRRC